MADDKPDDLGGLDISKLLSNLGKREPEVTLTSDDSTARLAIEGLASHILAHASEALLPFPPELRDDVLHEVMSRLDYILHGPDGSVSH